MERKCLLASLLSVLLVLSILAGISPSAYGASESNILDCAEFGWSGSVLILKKDGTIAAKLYSNPYTDSQLDYVKSWKNVVQIAVRDEMIAALHEDGTVSAVNLYEDEFYPDLSAAAKWKNIRSLIGFDGYHLFALGRDGKLYITGPEKYNGTENYNFSKWKDLKKIVAGVCGKSEYLLGLKADGTVIDVSDSARQQSMDPLPWTGRAENIVDIASNGWIDAALRADGTVIIKGADRKQYEKEVSRWKNIVRILADENFGLLGVMSDGTVVSTATGDYAEINSWKNVREIYSSPGGMVVGLCDDGKLEICPGLYHDWESMKKWSNLERFYLGDGIAVGWKRDGSIVTWNIDLTEID